MADLLRLTGVTRVFGAGVAAVTALRGVSLTVQAGEFTAIAGPSGSGKSTLLNLIGGLDRPTSGSIMVDGRELGGLSTAALADLRMRRIGFVFQAYNLFPVLTAMENAEYVLLLQGVPAAARRARVRELFAAVGLEGLEDRFPREMSGGQQQRVTLVRAIAAAPALVLADEPTANVDSTTAAGLVDLMLRLNAERGVTFLYSTHDRGVMARAHRLIEIRDGVVHEGTPPVPGS